MQGAPVPKTFNNGGAPQATVMQNQNQQSNTFQGIKEGDT